MAKSSAGKQGADGQKNQKTVASTFNQSLRQIEAKGTTAEPTDPFIRQEHRRVFVSNRMQ
jgi:hypothetical protein